MSPMLLTILYLVVFYAAFVAWQSGRGRVRGTRIRPLATSTAFVVVAVPSVVQLTMAPWLLDVWARDLAATWSGQPWRLVTALVVQDGGWAGTLFNLAALLWIGFVAEAVWGSRRWVMIALCAGIGAQLWGWLIQPFGAGNSVVVFGLAASVLVRGVASPAVLPRVAGLVGLLAAVVLLVGGDLHGGAAAIGALVALVLHGRDVRRARFTLRGGAAPDR